jgi:hypothetical protein
VAIVVAVGLAGLAAVVDRAPAERTLASSRHEMPAAPAGQPGAPDVPGLVLLDVAGARVEIVPGPEGEPIRTEVEHDAERFVLTERFDEGGQAGWTYELTLHRKPHFGLFLGSDTDNRVRLTLPRGVAFRLDVRLDASSSAIELGGLSVTTVDLAANVGTHELGFGEPLPLPLERLTHVRSDVIASRSSGNATHSRFM